MKQELELRHIAPYLPFRLQGTAKHKKDILCSLTGLGRKLGKTVDVEIKNGLSFLNVSFGLSNFKPILRPLSDLTKDEHIYNLGCCMYGSNFTDPDDCFESTILSLNHESLMSTHFNYDFFEYLFELKFDVFGLIEKGLAIDVNTLKDNPYE